MIAIDFDGFNNLCFRKHLYFFVIFCIFPFLWLNLRKDRSYLFCNDFLLILSTINSLKANNFPGHLTLLRLKNAD